MPRPIVIDPDNVDDASLDQAAAMLHSGLVVAYPTDTFYGLAVDPRNSQAVVRLYALKGRADSSAVPLIAADLAQAEACGLFQTTERQLAKHWWPGPLTLVVPAQHSIAREVRAGGDTIAVRVPDHAIARALARVFGFCITATSANRSGGRAGVTAGEVLTQLPDVDAVIDGGSTRGGEPSTIVEWRSGALRLIRPGAIAYDRVIRSLE
jgi:L-threonylcarbamoyladenylate synthase